MADFDSRLPVKDDANGPVTPGTVANASELIGGQYNSTLPTLTNGQQAAVQLDANGKLLTKAEISNLPAVVDTDYGVVGADTIRTASQIGNATGAADFDAGATGAQTLRVEANQGAAATAANGWPVKPTDGTNSQSYTSAGAAKIDIEQIVGSAPGAANALPIQISNGTNFNSPTSPIYVSEATAGAAVCDYKDAASIAAGASDDHDYTVTALKTLYLEGIESSASGKAKMVLAIETGVATGIFTTRAAQFNSTATPDMVFRLPTPIPVAAGVRVRVTMTNRDNQAQDLYSSILGFEI